MRTETPSLANASPELVVPPSTPLTRAQVEAIAAIKALRGMFSNQALLETEYDNAKMSETW